MFRYGVLIVFLGVLLGGFMPTGAAAAEARLVFEVKTGQILTVPAKDGQPQKVLPDHDLKMSLPGRLFQKPQVIKPNLMAGNKTPAALLATMLEANKRAAVPAMVGAFLPDEQPALLKAYKQPALVQSSAKFFQNISGMTYDGLAGYRGFVLLLVTYDTPAGRTRLVMPARQQGGHYYLTNGLASDSTLSEVLVAWHNQQVTPFTGEAGK